MPKPDEQAAQPNWSELDVLAVVWEAAAEKPDAAVRLSDVHRRLLERRASRGEGEPAITTVSSNLRALVAKGLLEEVALSSPSSGEFTRGMTRPPSRSPLTGYRPVREPGAVLEQVFKDLVSAYPQQVRYQALLDFARALELPRGTLKKLEKLMREEKLITEG